MGLKHHTIILVPHARARFRKWRVSNLQIGLAIAGASALTLGTTFVLWSYFTNSVDRRELDSVRQENQRLKKVNSDFETNLKSLESQLTEYEDRTRKLAIVAGLDTLADGAEAGVGGLSNPAADGPLGLASLTSRADGLSGELDQVELQLEERRQWLSATPSIAPVKGLLTSWFGNRRDPINGSRENHPAIDIAAPPGKPVIATADGIVTQSSDIGDGLGTAVSLSHGFGMTTRYGHMSRVNVKQGQKVKRGDIVGFVGSTGRSTGFHLHYEVLQDGKPVDPLAFILDGTQTSGP
jgi:murein DD-endopeptidase MepM/ murein hydrolase activator NlpD